MRIFIILSLIPVSSAMDCHELINSADDCYVIEASNLSSSEKDELIAGLVYNKGDYPGHMLIYDWNSRVGHSEDTITNEYIKDAWIKIVGASPSVEADGRLFIPDNGTLLIDYNYSIALPDSYKGSYPDSNNGDCKRDYNVLSKTELAEVLLNGKTIGANKKEVKFVSKRFSQFKASLVISLTIEEKRFKWHSYCCSYNKKGCIRRCNDCNLYSVNHITSSIEINKYLNAYRDSRKPELSIDVWKNKHYYEGKMHLDNYTGFRLTIGNSSYSEYNYMYQANYTGDGSLTLMALDNRNRYQSNIIMTRDGDKRYFRVLDFQDCTLEVWNHFYYISRDCKNYSILPELRIGTEKMYYKPNESIDVNIYPDNLPVNITYGKTTALMIGHGSLKAELNNNLISARSGEATAELNIHVMNQQRYLFLRSSLIFITTLSSACWAVKKWLVKYLQLL